MYKYMKSKIKKGYNSQKILADVIKHSDINNWTNNLPNLFELIEEIAERNEIIFINAGIIGNADEQAYESFVAQSIYEDLIDIGRAGTLKLLYFSNEIETVARQRRDDQKTFWQKIKFFFKSKKIEQLTSEETTLVNNYLSEFYSYYMMLKNYKMQDRIVCAVSKMFQDKVDRNKDDSRYALVSLEIIDDMEKLKCQEQCKELLKYLSKIYKMDLSNMEKNDRMKFIISLENGTEHPNGNEDEEYIKKREKIKLTINPNSDFDKNPTNSDER